MPNINITVAGKIATNVTHGVEIICGNSDYTITFTFDSEWTGKTDRTARFVYIKDGRSVYQDVGFTGDAVAVPVPVLSGVDYVLVGVFAGNLQTTTPAKVLCTRSILCMGQSEQLTPLGREQLQGIIATTQTAAQNAAASEREAEVWANAAAASQVQAEKAAEAAAAALATLHGAAGEGAPAIVCETTGEIVQVADASDRPLRGLTLYGKTAQNGTPTPTSPVELVSVGASGNIGITVAGKNMFPKASAGVLTESGITLTSNGDGSYSAKGTATSDVTLKFPLEEGVVLEEGMYLHCMNNASSGISFVYWYSDLTSSYWALIPANRISAPTKNFGKTITQIGINMKSGNTVDVTFSPMFMFSDKAMDFVPYQSIQTITAATPNGLPGIPVSSGGNYTDENGQQWICDEVDFARGVYVRRIVVTDMAGCTIDTSTYKSVNRYNKFIGTRLRGGEENCAMCSYLSRSLYGYSEKDESHYFNSPAGTLAIFLPKTANVNMATLKMAVCLETPVETPLSAETMAAYYALHSNKPTTTVYNDAGTGMAVKYVADTKNYIDQKLAAISAAVLNK